MYDHIIFYMLANHYISSTSDTTKWAVNLVVEMVWFCVV